MCNLLAFRQIHRRNEWLQQYLVEDFLSIFHFYSMLWLLWLYFKHNEIQGKVETSLINNLYEHQVYANLRADV